MTAFTRCLPWKFPIFSFVVRTDDFNDFPCLLSLHRLCSAGYPLISLSPWLVSFVWSLAYSGIAFTLGGLGQQYGGGSVAGKTLILLDSLTRYLYYYGSNSHTHVWLAHLVLFCPVLLATLFLFGKDGSCFFSSVFVARMGI